MKKLLQNTYHHQRNRFEYAKRDVVKSIRIRKITEYDVSSDSQRTTFVVESSSYPNYSPYYTPKDERGRPRKYQRKYKHQYDVTIQLDRLSINVPVKLRTGSQKEWKKGARIIKKGKRIIKDNENVLNGINGDFLFRLEYLYRREGILYGRDRTRGVPPLKTNPKMIVFLDKHTINTVQALMMRGLLKDD